MEYIRTTKRPETVDALSRLTIDLIREQDALRDVALHVTAMETLAANPMAKSALAHIAADAEWLARRLEPVRAYAWTQLKQLGGQGSDEA